MKLAVAAALTVALLALAGCNKPIREAGASRPPAAAAARVG